MMTGLFRPSAGDAIIYGHSIIDGMDEIRKVMGVCPQVILFCEMFLLTNSSMIFCGIK